MLKSSVQARRGDASCVRRSAATMVATGGGGVSCATPCDTSGLVREPAWMRTDTNLRPYLRARSARTENSLVLRVMGSAVAAAWQHVAFFVAYGVGVALLCDFVVEERLPELFDVPFDSFVTAALVAVGFFLTAKLFGVLAKYATGVQVFYDTADAIATAWLHIQAQVTRRPLTSYIEMPRYARPAAATLAAAQPPLAERHVYMEAVQEFRMVEELQHVWRALIFAIKWQFRTQVATSRYQTSVSADVDLDEASVDPFKLPMPQHLVNELLMYKTDYVGGLLNMAAHRHVMLINGDSRQDEFSAYAVHINAVGTQSARMAALQVLGLPPPVADMLYAAMLVVFLLAPWAAWSASRYYLLVAYVLEVAIMWGVWGLSNQIGNPFNRADDSPFVYHDIGAMSRSVAANVDNQADKFIAEIVAAHKFGAARGAAADDGAAAAATAQRGDDDNNANMPPPPSSPVAAAFGVQHTPGALATHASRMHLQATNKIDVY